MVGAGDEFDFSRQESRRSAQSTFTELVGTKRREPVVLKARQGQQIGQGSKPQLSSRSFAVHQAKYSPFDDLLYQQKKTVFKDTRKSEVTP